MNSKYSHLSTQEKYDILTKDFLERDGDRFVRIRTSDRLGWERTLPEGSAYSAVILNPKSDRELYGNAVMLARQMITSMDTPYRVDVRVDPTRSCTDSHCVYVATKVFDDPDIDLGTKLDTFLGLTIHEGCHLLYTDFKTMRKNRNYLIHQLQNIFEDERIERELGESKPGLANFLKATKYYYFGRYKKETEDAVQNKATRLYNSILAIVRYPACLDPEDALEFANELLQVRDILTPYPGSTGECIEAATKVYNLFKQYLEQEKGREEERQRRQQQRTDQQKEDPQENSGNPGEESRKTDNGQPSKNRSRSGKPGQDNSSGNPSNKNDGDGKEPSETQEDKEKAEKENPGDKTESTGKSSGREAGQDKDASCGDESDGKEDKTSTGTTAAEGGENNENDSDSEDPDPVPMSDDEVTDLLDDILKAFEVLTDDPAEPGTKNPLTKDDTARALLKNDALLAKECEGVLEIGHEADTVLVRQDNNKPRYDQSLARVRRYIPTVAQALKSNGNEYKYTVTGMRSGLLDTNKLCEARQGVQNVYMKKGEVTCDSVNVVLVIDESGSMEGRREMLARDTAVLVNEAVGKLRNIGLYIYGYTSGCEGAALFPYREGAATERRYSIGSIASRGGTPTAPAMLETAWRVRRSSREKTLMFVISDGMADGGMKAVRQATDHVQKQGFEVIGISISSSLGKEHLAMMYDHYIVMDNLDNLASELGKTVKKAVLKNAKRHVA